MNAKARSEDRAFVHPALREKMASEPLRPAFWARSPHVQTIFGSLKLRAVGKNEMTDASQEVITDAGPGVRLLGFHSRQRGRSPRGLIILIHGWEGSSDSTYILSTGRFFFRLGYDIFRLNLRDHGQSHHLNPGLFHGALTDETAQAVANAARLLPDLPCYLVGFSLGGNFALRIALRQSDLTMSQSETGLRHQSRSRSLPVHIGHR